MIRRRFSCFRASVRARLPARKGLEKGCVHVGEQTGAALTNANVDLTKNRAGIRSETALLSTGKLGNWY